MTMSSYTGGCQCGAVRFRVEADIDNTMSCNCSRCGKLGSILTFSPASAFTLETDPSALSDYQFNKKAIHHLFCSTCGIESFARGTTPTGDEMVAINVRCLDGVDIDKLSPRKVDGRSF
ncbi:MAG: GFA family protein [Rhizobiales bacterium]|nr:GFA family protein [Hyphomicrobiales bacterium]